MFHFLNAESPSLSPKKIASSLRWLGWAGFWLQALFGFIPILVVVANVLFNPGSQQSGGFSFGLWLAIICLLILLFSIFWCFRYTQLATRLEAPTRRPPKSQVVRDLKLGLVANLGIMASAVLIALTRVGELTYKMLVLPQGATLITPNQVGTTVARGALVTPSNMIAIQAMVNAIAAGLIGTIVALILLFQLGIARPPNDSSPGDG